MAGCATFQSSPPLNTQITQQWQFTGKFAVRTPDDKNSAKMHWSQINEQYDINLYTLFGISLMSIIGDDRQVTINNRGDEYVGVNAQQLIYRLTRWHLPVNDLQHWVTGTVHHATQVKYDTQGNFYQGNITSADNKQWQLTLSHYKDIDGKPRPHKLLLKSGKTYFKLAISQWKIQH
jgi:outer membrane lipoprotein LolB